MTIKTRSTAATETAAEAPKRKTLSRARKPAVAKVEETKTADVVDAMVAPVSSTPAAQPGVALEGLDRPVTGRGVFAVRTLGTAVSVESAFLEEGGNVLRLPAVFPNRAYALEQLDELRQLVNRHFDEVEKGAVS